MILESDKALNYIDPYGESGGDYLIKPMSTQQTETRGVLDSLFGTLEKGADLWTKWQVSKNNLTAEQIRQTSVTDVNRQPAADTGDTISPGWASFEIATPENGARITMSSIAVCCSATCCSATAICSRSESTRATSAFTSAFAASISAAVTRPSFARRSRR